MRSLLFINYEYPPVGAGAATASHHFTLQLAAQGKQVTVLTSAFGDKRGKSMENGVTVRRIPAWRTSLGQSSLRQMLAFLISSLVHLPLVVRTVRPDCAVIFFAFPCGPVGPVLRFLLKTPYILMLRGSDVPGSEPSLDGIHRLLRPVRKVVYRYSSAIIANSNSLRDLALQSDPNAVIDVVPNGVDTDYFKPADDAGDYRQHPFTFMFAGRICVQKNLTILIDAFAACCEKYNDLQLVIIGEGPELPLLRKRAAEIVPTATVKWYGWSPRNELVSAYRKAHCFVCPSINEGMSNAVLEAMACGLPVIASDCPGNRELIIEEETGYPVETFSLQALIDRMATYIRDPELAVRHGQNGRTRCVTHYSWETASRKLIATITTGLAKHETV